MGRTIDFEMPYRVEIDRDGNRVKDLFQGPVHVPYRFHGERFGDRPILRIATRNNLFTSNVDSSTPRWSDAPLAPTAKRPTDRELMLDHPWTFAVMGSELIREGKVTVDDHDRQIPHAKSPRLTDAVLGGNVVADARRYLYLEPDDPARKEFEQTGKLNVVLKDGSVRTIEHDKRHFPLLAPFRAPSGTAIRLPKSLRAEDVVGLETTPDSRTVPTRVFVLDRKYHPRVLDLVGQLSNA
jgi:hypothetical protein